MQFLQAQTPWRIDKLGMEEGLSEGYVYAIHQDKKGFIWIGTHGGLNRYDGYGFKVFQYMPFDSTTLADNSIFFLKEDTLTGKFWLGGSSGLNEFDPVTFKNIRYRPNAGQIEFADGIFVNDHEMLLACQSRVFIFDTKKKSFKPIAVFDENNRQTAVARVENVAADLSGNFMIMSKTGIYFYDPATQSCRRKTLTSPDFSPFYQYEVFNVLEDKRGNYWIATNRKGLIRYDAASKITKTLEPPPPLRIENMRFDAIAEDSQGAIWAGGSNGLFKVEPVSLTAEYFSSEKLSHPEVNVIHEDRNHILWIGTVGGGINKMVPQNAGFRNIVLSETRNGNRTGTYVMAMQQSGNDIWFLNIWDQVGKASLSTGKIQVLNKAALPANYSWYSEGSMIKDRNGNPVILNGENSYEVQTASSGNITLKGRAAPGMYHVHYRNDRALYFVHTDTGSLFLRNDTLYGDQVFYDSEEDKEGNIWIGSNQGLIKLNPQTAALRQFRHNDRDANSISSDYIYALEVDSASQTIWMAAYNGGLCSYNISSGKFRHYSKEDGLADNIVYSIEKDLHGNLWFSTNAGISNYDIASNSFRNFRTSDGLLNHEFNRQSSCKNDQGWIFFGGIFGIDYFHPDSIVKTNTIPALAFTNFRVYNKDYVRDYRQQDPVIELNHNDRFISIEFAALDYNDQEKIQYAYRLNNNEWIRIGNQHILSFSNLATGAHVLQIRSTNAEGKWLDNQISCTLNIHPSWWQQTWFRFVLASLLVLACVLAVRSYYGRKLQRQRLAFEKQQAVERERTRIATDMHDDLGAGLTRIKFITENMIERNNDPRMHTDVQKLKSSSNELVEKMGEIIWAMNEKNNSLEDLLFYLRSYAMDYCLENDLSCNFVIPDQLPAITIDGQTRRNIFLVLKESLHNIVKHAAARQVTIRVQADDKLILSVSDDGKGFMNGHAHNGNGLLNMKKRAADLKGRLSISADGATTIRLEVPLV